MAWKTWRWTRRATSPPSAAAAATVRWSVSPRIWTRCFPPAPASRSGARATGCSRRASATTRSLSVLLAWVRALDAAGIRTRADILFVADVGEEGPGDLRGMRHLFQKGPYRDRIDAFITVDSPDIDGIVTSGIGSKRYRVTFHGPGGHSFSAFGLVDPMYAMARTIDQLGRLAVPGDPKTTFCASVTGGGTSINSIPDAVWTDFDLRSASALELGRLEAEFLTIVDAAVRAENQARSVASGPVTAEIKLPETAQPAAPIPIRTWCAWRMRRSARTVSNRGSRHPPPTRTFR